MLASHTPDLMAATGSLANERVNAAARIARSFGDFLTGVIADNRHARETGKTIVDIYVNPDGREGDGSRKIKTYPTDASETDARNAIERVFTLARLASRVVFLKDREDDISRIEAAVTSALASLATIDRDLWTVYVQSEKQYMSGPESAILETDGFAWTDSRKGHATTIRYDESAQPYTRQSKALTSQSETYGLSERDLAEIMSEEG